MSKDSGQAPIGQAFDAGHEIVIVGVPKSDVPEDSPEFHNCDAMGCGSFSHVLYRFPKPLQTLERQMSLDIEANALKWIADTIAADKAKGCYGHVEEEVVAEFNKYRKNDPQGSPMAHAQSAMHECAHQ